MRRSKKLAFLGKFTENREKIAAKMFANAKLKYEKEVKRLEDLKAYEKEYGNYLATTKNDSLTTASIENYYNFLEHLKKVMKGQGENIATAAAEMKQKQKFWQSCYHQNKSLHNYLDNMKAKEDEEIQRKEQKAEDTMVNDIYGRGPKS